ncbi:ubiquitin-like domain-containing protein CIP73 isoform X3 [Gossypium arboreum]|uniref:ubiquitin-like domain-containing protein CIP73 isoform X3 n=1 Tax=Gossypium arboreum TaxID=29729 RepID=UPI0008194ACA|nr:ubiquitin-like domain-containing protein CIP73 isoform X3 [Gossypium arboreum]
MGSTSADKVPSDTEMEGSEATIEIKIKTLDSQTYTLRVDKQMPVPALKEQIASVTGVLSEQQRLICRGKVLKDDQLLSAYHVEDGHTLHLVVRQPVPPSSDGSPYHSANDPSSDTSRGHSNHAPSFVIETFNVPDQGDGVPPEISRQIVSAVLGSFGFANMASGNTGSDARDHGSQRQERTSGGSGMPDSSQAQTEQASMTSQSDRAHSAFGLPAAVSLGPMHPPVIPDSLATLSQYLSHIRNEFDALGRVGGNDSQTTPMSRTGSRDSNSASNSGTGREGLPTPASLAEVLLSTRQMLIEQAGESVQQLARQLEDQVNVTDPSARLIAQTNALRTGALLHNLGSLLLELGRTTMTLRLGQTPSEAVVNAGPAVFISPSGPNPLMVQALPFQPGPSFGAIPVGTVQPGSGLVNGLGTGFVPRRIDIQIRRGSSMTTPNTREEHPPSQSGQSNQSVGSHSENRSSQTTSRVSDTPSFAGESGVRVVPIRTMVAAVPAPLGRLPSESSGNSVGVYYPLLGRLQNIAPGHVSGERGPQASGEHPSSGAQPEQVRIPESAVQHQSSEESARDVWKFPCELTKKVKSQKGKNDNGKGKVKCTRRLTFQELTIKLLPAAGSLPNANSRQQERPNTRSVNISILAAGRTQNNQDSERQSPSNVLQFLRSIFPGGEIQVEEASSQGTARDSVRGQAEASNDAPAAETSITNQGVFLSNLLHQIMPYISQHAGSQRSTPEEATTSAPADLSSTGNSRRPNDTEQNPPNSKRQKME